MRSIDDAFDMNMRSCEIDQQTNLEAGCLEISEALRSMNLIESLRGLEFDDYSVINKDISQTRSHNYTSVENVERMLLLEA